MKVLRVLAILLLIPIVCFADYKIVVKKTGKVIEGKYVSEDDKTINLLSPDGIKISFKKELLDLDKMKDLNANVQTQPAPPKVEKPKEPNEYPNDSELVALSKKTKAQNSGKDKHNAKVKSGPKDDDQSANSDNDDSSNANGSSNAGQKLPGYLDPAVAQYNIELFQKRIQEYQDSIDQAKALGKDSSYLQKQLEITKRMLDEEEARSNDLPSQAKEYLEEQKQKEKQKNSDDHDQGDQTQPQ